MALWRPAERANALYDVTVAVRGGSKLVRRVGFRTVALITHRQSATHNATGDWTMRVAINGAPVFLRGGSWVPSSFYEAQVNDANLVAAVESAAAAGFNALRIWGGGVYQYESFYDACDRLGIVLWHDMMLSSPGRNQPSLDPPDMTEEATYQARRLSSHASVVVWDACNECAFMPDFFRASQSALQALVREDLSRIVWPASPSLGWVSGVDPATSLPLYWNVKLVPQPWRCKGGLIASLSLSLFVLHNALAAPLLVITMGPTCMAAASPISTTPLATPLALRPRRHQRLARPALLAWASMAASCPSLVPPSCPRRGPWTRF